jgi:gas vesicle protein
VSNKGDVTLTIDGDSSGLTAALHEGAAAVTETTAQIKESLESVKGGFETLTTSWTQLAALMAGGEIGEAMAKVAERADDIKDTADTLGMTAQQFQGLQVVAAESGVSQEMLGRQLDSLRSKMSLAGEEGGNAAAQFNALGITTAELRDPTFSVQDAMEKLGESSNSSAALLGVLGARAGVLIPVMRELAENHNAASEAAAKAGALTDTEIAQLQHYQATIQIASTQWDNFKARVLGSAIPAFNAVIAGFGDTANAAGQSSTALDTVRVVVEAIGTAFIGVRFTVQTVTQTVVAAVRAWVDSFVGVGKAAWDALHGRLGAAGEDMRATFNSVNADLSAFFDSIKDNASQAATSFTNLRSAMSGVGTVAPPVEKAAPTSLLPDLSKQKDELKDWAQVWADKAAVIKAELKGIDEAFAEMEGTLSAQAKGELDTQLGALSQQQAAVKEAYDQHRISAQQEYQQSVELIQQELVARMQYFAQLEELAAGDQAKLSNVMAQEAATQQKYLQQIQAAHQQYSQNISRQWQGASNTIANSFSQLFNGMLTRSQTLTQGVANMFKSLGSAVVGEISKMLAQWVVSHLIAMTLNKQEASSNAAVAATGAAKSAAQTPYIGWLLAIPAAAAVFAAATGYSAQGGFDIPRGLEPVTQLHSREMVLPEKHADTIRDLGERGGPGGVRDVHLHVHAADGGSVRRMFLDNKHALAETLRGLVRDGHLTVPRT